jgi:hypothetical protein
LHDLRDRWRSKKDRAIWKKFRDDNNAFRVASIARSVLWWQSADTVA